jgi:hypothetical protein
VQRCERLELVDLAAHLVVDEHGLAEARAAVDDAVRDPFDILHERVDHARLVALDDVQLQARGACVDYEYGQTQSRTSAWSSPYSRVQAR